MNNKTEVTENKVPEAIEILRDAMKDPSYRIGWEANIAMAFKDEYQRQGGNESASLIHSIANKAANNFIDSLCFKPEQES